MPGHGAHRGANPHSHPEARPGYARARDGHLHARRRGHPATWGRAHPARSTSSNVSRCRSHWAGGVGARQAGTSASDTAGDVGAQPKPGSSPRGLDACSAAACSPAASVSWRSVWQPRVTERSGPDGLRESCRIRCRSRTSIRSVCHPTFFSHDLILHGSHCETRLTHRSLGSNATGVDVEIGAGKEFEGWAS